MADTKISDLAEGTVLSDADEFVFVDKSDTSMSAAGTDKRTLWSTIKAAIIAFLGTSAVVSAKAWRGQIHGLTLSNNTTDATNDIDIAAGQAWDNTNDVLLDLTSVYVKRLDANWAVGTNQGGLDTGSKTNSTWYHVWIIRRSDTGVVDVLLSASATSPTMPSNYDGKRRIGTIYNNSSGVISPFTQTEDEFFLTTAVQNTSTPSVGAANLTMRTPLGIRTRAIVYLYVAATTTAKSLSAYSIGGELHEVRGPVGDFDSRTITLRTNTSSQIGYFTSSASDITISIVTYGWYDSRGRYS